MGSRQDIGHRAGLWTVMGLLALCAPAWAIPSSPTLLYQTPTADVLPAGALAISADGTFPLTNTSVNVNYPEADAYVRFSPFRRFDFAITAYTFTDYVLDVKYKVLGNDPERFGLAVGMYDIGLHSYVSPLGHDTANAWPDWKWSNRQSERFSAYAVASIPLWRSVRLHAGLGRGRFVGYSTDNRYLNTDLLFGEGHQWSLGLFGGVEYDVTPQVTLVAEAGGRDLNSGVKVSFNQFTATVAWNKMEGLLLADEAGGTAKFGRLEVALGYQFSLFRQARAAPHHVRQPGPPTIAVPPSPPPVPASQAPSPAQLNFKPVFFDSGSSAITDESEDTLIYDAARLLAHPDVKVVVNGYAAEEGTAEEDTALSRRRASAVFQYLKLLGVPESQMRYRTMGDVHGLLYPSQRVVTIEVDIGQ